MSNPRIILRNFILILSFIWSAVTNAQIQSVPGFFDLSDQPNNQVISLNGEWEFYWGELIEPGKFPNSGDFIFFPSLWNNQTIGDSILTGFGCATYRARLILSPDVKYTMHIEDMYSALRLYINGQIVFENGKVASSKREYVPEWKPAFFGLHALSDTNELVLQIANYDHIKGGALEGIELGEDVLMKSKESGILIRDLILTGSLIMGGLFFLGLYFFGQHDRAILYFSLFCVVYSYRIIGFGYYIFHTLVDWPWHVTTRLEYISLFLSTFLFGRFVKHLYPKETPQIVMNVLSVICLIFIGMVVVSPPYIFTRLVEPFFVILIGYIVFVLIIYVRARINRQPGSQFAYMSTAVVFSVFVYNILVYFGILKSWDAASFWGYMLFFFSQSLILSYRFAFYLKDAKKQAELAVAAKTEFLSTISHEIRTPLNAVVGISHFMLMDNPREDQKDNLYSLKYSADHLTSLINDILDYNKMETGFVEFEMLDTDLVEVVNRIFQAYNAKALAKGVKVILDFDSEIKDNIITDKTRLVQILSNLMDNAVKFTKEGEIILKISKLSETEEKITLRFDVSDTGVGIPEDKQTIIFERFTQASSSTTREYGGTGLGLSIIKKLLELQGSKIHLKSEPEKGSTFYFRQTFEKGQKLQTKLVDFEELYQVYKLADKRVLIVDDNDMNVVVAKKFLSKWKVKVDEAHNGEEAVRKANSNYYDLILMDLQMPVMDGYQAAYTIRNSGNTVPIVALTASALISIKDKVLASGMNDYLTKPFNPDDLKKKLIKNMR